VNLTLRKAGIAASLLCLSLIVAGPVPASASGFMRKLSDTQSAGLRSLDEQVAAALSSASAPGGVRTSMNRVSWRGGDVTLKFPLPEGLRDLDGAPLSSVSADRSRARSVRSAALRRAGETLYDYGCPHGVRTFWFCFYENTNFNGVQKNSAGPGNGRMLEFKSSGYQDLGAYGFRDKTSSWVTTDNSRNVRVYDYRPGGTVCGEQTLLWTEKINRATGYVGDASNDRADCFYAYG
jgi:hypothetical protein